MKTVIFAFLTLILYNANAQTTWHKRRDWLIGDYIAYYKFEDTSSGSWKLLPYTFNISYYSDSSVITNTLSGDDNIFLVCEDSTFAGYNYAYSNGCSVSYMHYAGFNQYPGGGRIFSNDSINVWGMCLPVYQCIYTWMFIKAKKIPSSINNNQNFKY